MSICFYNLYHIGDIYFNYFFINTICNQNPNINFYYYFINGSVFFENIKNISRINPIESKYSDNLIDGYPPEYFLNNKILIILLQNNMKQTAYRKLIIDNKEYLFVNLWCASDLLSHGDFDFISAIPKFGSLINQLNSEFSFNLNYSITNNKSILQNNINQNLDLNSLNLTEDELSKTTLIFNFMPRSAFLIWIYLINLYLT